MTGEPEPISDLPRSIRLPARGVAGPRRAVPVDQDRGYRPADVVLIVLVMIVLVAVIAALRS